MSKSKSPKLALGLDPESPPPASRRRRINMKVAIKTFDDVKNNGIEFEVNDNNGRFLGDFYVTKSGVTWCPGRTRKKNGKKLTWKEVIKLMNSA
jgi:hypothetical protein